MEIREFLALSIDERKEVLEKIIAEFNSTATAAEIQAELDKLPALNDTETIVQFY